MVEHDIIIRPIITEASMAGVQNKKYTFEVARKATKPEIRKAAEKIFGIIVTDVNTINVKRKPNRLGVHQGYTRQWKKAIITASPESKTIAFFEGMM